MKNRLTSSIIVILMMVSFMQVIPTKAYAAVKIGDYVVMGKYNGEPILWRCVDIDENGPLMLSDRILTIKAFDAKGEHKYLDGTLQADVNNYRKDKGSNLWQTSSLRSWLNSTAEAGKVTWLDGCPPSSENVLSDAYADEKGFLAEGDFSAVERNAIKSVKQKSLLYYRDVDKLSEGGGDFHSYNNSIETVVQNYDEAYYQNLEDKMFLLDVKQLNKVYVNRSILGEDYYIGKPTQKAVDTAKDGDAQLSVDKNCTSWLRSPYSLFYDPSSVRIVYQSGEIYNNSAYTFYTGVRPAFYLNLSSVSFRAGNGSVENPYLINDGSSYITYLENFNYAPEVYNDELALRAAEYSMLAYDDYRYDFDSSYWTSNRVYNPTILKGRLAQQKFSNIKTFNYNDNDYNNVGFVLASKDVNYNGKIRKLTTLIIRGTDGVEWYGNMDVTGTQYDASKTTHYSFDAAKSQVVFKLIQYLQENYISDTLLLVTGHSRGAAVANLVADYMTEVKSSPSFRVGEVYAYTFATPNVTTKPNITRTNIFNFCFRDDFVPQVPLTNWGYDKHGKTFFDVAEYLYRGNEDFKSDMKKFTRTSLDFREEPDFNYKATKDLISYVRGTWGNVERYYNKNIYPPILTVDKTLYNFFRNFVASTAIEPNATNIAELTSNSLSTPCMLPIFGFFVGGQALNKNINDTHQMFTYYAALKNGGFRNGGGDAFIYSNKSSAIARPSLISPSNADPREIEMIRAFALQGDNFKKLGWNLEDIGTWKGILWNEAAVNKVVSIDISYKGLSGTLDLSGFSNLQTINCSGNLFAGTNLNNCNALVEVNCDHNNLASISLENSGAIKSLDISWNKITQLSLETNTSLKGLYCNNNELTVLNINKNTQLTDLYCSNNELKTLDIASNLLLNTLDCEENYLDIQEASTMLNNIYTVKAREHSWVKYEIQNIPDNPQFNVEDVAKLKLFLNQGNNSEKLMWNIEKPQEWFGIVWTKVKTEYRVSRVQLDKLDLTGSLDLSNMPYLSYLSCKENRLESVKTANCTSLRYLDCSNSSVKTVDISNCSALTILECEDNYLVVSETSALMNDISKIGIKEETRLNYKNQKIIANKDRFNENEYNILASFAKLSENLSILNWDIDKPGEWSGVRWELKENQYRVKEISFDYRKVTGGLELSGFNELTKLNCALTSISSISLPDSIISMEPSMFYDCSELTNVKIPDSVTSIGEDTFYNCGKLSTITLPNSLKTIGSNAFRACKSLTFVEIPSSVQGVGDNGFSGCPLTSVKFLGNAPSMGKSVFENSSEFIIYYYYGKTGYADLWNGYKTQAVYDKCDINKDGNINILDLAFMAKKYNNKSTQSDWNSQFDLNADGVVNIFDLVIVSKKMTTA